VSGRSFPSGRPTARLQTSCRESKFPRNGMKTKINHKARPVELGEYIVADPRICHGRPTFKRTRVMVFQVLEQVACGTPWERIVWSWRGKVPMAAITEAVKLASDLFRDEGVFTPHAHYRRKHLGNRNLAAA
jgi:uncharacterized protein (DUF433 family)